MSEELLLLRVSAASNVGIFLRNMPSVIILLVPFETHCQLFISADIINSFSAISAGRLVNGNGRQTQKGLGSETYRQADIRTSDFRRSPSLIILTCDVDEREVGDES